MDAVHHGGVLEYDSHSLYGTMETIYTRNALETLRKERSVVISRSTFAGQGCVFRVARVEFAIRDVQYSLR